MKTSQEAGQTLIVLLIFVLMAVLVASTAIFVVTANAVASNDLSMGISTKQMADSGIETAYIKLLRDPSYVGETINEPGGGTIVVSVSWFGENATIVSTATNGTYSKRVESVVTNSQNVLTQVYWKEK